MAIDSSNMKTLIILLLLSLPIIGSSQDHFIIQERLDSILDNHYVFKLKKNSNSYDAVVQRDSAYLSLFYSLIKDKKLQLEMVNTFRGLVRGTNPRRNGFVIYKENEVVLKMDSVYAIVEDVKESKFNKGVKVKIDSIDQLSLYNYYILNVSRKNNSFKILSPKKSGIGGEQIKVGDILKLKIRVITHIISNAHLTINLQFGYETLEKVIFEDEEILYEAKCLRGLYYMR